MPSNQFKTVVSAVCLLMAASLQPAMSQQSKPVVKKSVAKNSNTAANCTRKGGDCCKGTPSRFAVLATTVAKPKQVKKD